MSETPLFPDLPEQLSPRLAWIRKHKVITYHSLPDEKDAAIWFATFDSGDWKYKNPGDYFAQEWGSYGETRSGMGATEDEAILDLCKHHGAPKHWSLS